MIDYNLVLYIGIALIVGGGVLFFVAEHFELHDSNKDAMLQRNKLKYLEDRITTLEKSIASLTKVVGELREMDIKRTLGLEK